MRTMTLAVVLALSTFAAGCSVFDGATGNIHATDPVERGLSYVAVAIVFNGVLRAVCNK